MKVEEIFGRSVNIASKKGIDEALFFLQLPSKRLDELIKKKKYIVSFKNFDAVIDFKAKFKQINIYLTQSKWSKKLLLSLKKSSDFKSMTILLGNVQLQRKNFELRLGAFGISSSDLTKSIIKYKK